jgi:hypothetical protein
VNVLTERDGLVGLRETGARLLPLFLGVTLQSGSARAGPRPRVALSEPQVRVAATVPSITVVVTVVTGGRQLFLPACGESDTGIPFLCDASVRLEAQSNGKWHAAQLETRYGLQSVTPLAKVGGGILSAQVEHTAIFRFDRAGYRVKGGQRLRLVLETWPDEQAMRSGAAPTRLTSGAFRCPVLGLPVRYD